MAPRAEVFPDGVGGGFEPRWPKEKEVKPAVKVVESIFLEVSPRGVVGQCFLGSIPHFPAGRAGRFSNGGRLSHGIQVAP